MPHRLVLETEGSPRAFLLAEGESLVGSGEGCDVRLTDPTISRRHAVRLPPAASFAVTSWTEASPRAVRRSSASPGALRRSTGRLCATAITAASSRRA